MILALDEAAVRLAVDAVANEATAGPAEAGERFARGVFTMIAEPGDAAAGLLLRALGPLRALSHVVRRDDARTVSRLVDDPEDAASLAHTLPAALERWRPRLSSKAAIDAFRHAAHLGASFLVPGDAGWPAGLDDLGDHAPAGLWVRGDATRLVGLSHAVALVGARAATGYGTAVAAELASGAADRGLAVVSGAAYGIDGMAHRATLASAGLTVAILAGGIDKLYPSGHAELLAGIIRDGVVVAEMPCGFSPTRWRFLLRNRLIAACSTATVVVEAGARSGSLNTAGHAAELGRALGAVPGPVTSPASAGCHRLIREYDAQLVTCPDDMAELAGLAPAEAVLPAV
ncbi:MAG TPA: DNA-processing protein DprA, partial [Microbacteriaceae bacterium]|nr:DNA-processing protein DprA [Microbacteriaceae bacterium]